MQRGQHRPSALAPEQLDAFRQRLDAGPDAQDRVYSLRGRDIQRTLQEEFGVLRSLAGVYYLQQGLGYSYLRPRPRHRKANPEAFATFVRELPPQLLAIVAQHPDKRLRIYFHDESRFDQQGTTTNVWAPTGARPTAIRQTEYRYLWVLAAVCPEMGHAEG